MPLCHNTQQKCTRMDTNWTMTLTSQCCCHHTWPPATPSCSHLYSFSLSTPFYSWMTWPTKSFLLFSTTPAIINNFSIQIGNSFNILVSQHLGLFAFNDLATYVACQEVLKILLPDNHILLGCKREAGDLRGLNRVPSLQAQWRKE